MTLNQQSPCSSCYSLGQTPLHFPRSRNHTLDQREASNNGLITTKSFLQEVGGLGNRCSVFVLV